jgi:hypothetical protein
MGADAVMDDQVPAPWVSMSLDVPDMDEAG